MFITVLGETYEVIESHSGDDTMLETCNGYCDSSVKRIVINKFREHDDYKKRVMRHEIIHAFLCESGLDANSWGCNEEIVDWMALQFEKMKDAFEKAGAI